MITPQKQRAIECLLQGSQHKVAAEAAGVARETVTNWVNHDCEFKDALHNARMEILKAVVNEFMHEIRPSLRRLADIRDDEMTPRKEALSASDKILQRIIDVTAFVESHDTIRRLEQELEELRNAPVGNQAAQGTDKPGAK